MRATSIKQHYQSSKHIQRLLNNKGQSFLDLTETQQRENEQMNKTIVKLNNSGMMKLIQMNDVAFLIFFFTEDNGMSIMCTDGEKDLYNAYFPQEHFIKLKE